MKLLFNVVSVLFFLLLNNSAEVETETVETESKGDDYFSSFTTLVDDDGKELSDPDVLGKKDDSGDLKDSKGEPEVDKKNNGEPDKTKENPKKGEGEQKDPEKESEGFVSRFFDKSEKGELSFKAEEALDFMAPNKESEHAFRYSPISVITDEEAKARKGNESPEVTKTTKDELLEMNKHFGEVEQKMFSPISIIASAIDKGYSVEQALQLAQSEVRKELAAYQTEKKAEFEANYYDRLEKNGMTKEQNAKMMQQVSINESKMHQFFGGKEAFESVFFAHKGKDGKLTPGLATEDLWMAFKIANPQINEKKLTQSELHKEMENWYPKFASNMENLLWLKKVAMATMFEKTKPHIINAIRKQGMKSAASKNEGKQNGPGGIKTPAKGAKGDSEMEAFFNPTAKRGIASV